VGEGKGEVEDGEGEDHRGGHCCPPHHCGCGLIIIRVVLSWSTWSSLSLSLLVLLWFMVRVERRERGVVHICICLYNYNISHQIQFFPSALTTVLRD
jgi:hypothetical protein